MNVHTYTILGYLDDKAKELSPVPIHFVVDDMQISEDMKLVVGRMITQCLYQNCSSKA